MNTSSPTSRELFKVLNDKGMLKQDVFAKHPAYSHCTELYYYVSKNNFLSKIFTEIFDFKALLSSKMLKYSTLSTNSVLMISEAKFSLNLISISAPRNPKVQMKRERKIVFFIINLLEIFFLNYVK